MAVPAGGPGPVGCCSMRLNLAHCVESLKITCRLVNNKKKQNNFIEQ